jgi:hypothetical protein
MKNAQIWQVRNNATVASLLHPPGYAVFPRKKAKCCIVASFSEIKEKDL